MTLEEVIQIAVRSHGALHFGQERVDEAGGLYPPSPYYHFFRLLASEFKPAVSVVLGVCGGGDCYHLCQGNPNGVVVGVDIVRDHEEQIANIEKQFPHFLFHKGDSVASAKILFDCFGPIDFLFIDTSHTKEQTLAEFAAYRPYLSPGAIVCFDDLFRPGMDEAWAQVPEPRSREDFLHPGEYPHGGGFGLWVAP